ncbi:SCO family protein [Rosistilla carotiformis]|uniref:SCO family protein n=1 Tax=Rosistilla carotiformis TaxID=2528017 RepID=UPI0018D238EA|nr:SCO family protein [Rosistilla carotiformis]
MTKPNATPIPFRIFFAVCWSLVVSNANGQLIKDLPTNVQEVGVEQRLGEPLPLNAVFFDERGQKVRLQQFFDGQRPVLVTLNYSDCPMLCSLQLNKLVSALDALDLDVGKDFQIVTISIDPKESPFKAQETKSKYVSILPREGVADGWHFLTGNQESITKIADAVGFRYKFIPETGQYSHAAMLAFCTPEGTISSYLLLIDYPADQVKLGLLAAGGGKIGSLVDNFVLYCSVYNPLEGSYTASAWKIMRLCGAATVVLLLVGLVPYWLGRRKTSADLSDHELPNPTRMNVQHPAGHHSH